MDHKRRKQIVLAVVAVLVVGTVIGDFVIHPHHVYFPWQIKQLDLVFGFVGAALLMAFSLGLGEVFLWKHTLSVSLGAEDVGADRTATVDAWLVETGARVRQGDEIVRLTKAAGAPFTLTAPLGGRLQRCFADPGEPVRDGETVYDLNVSKRELHDLVVGRGEGGGHA